VTRIADLLAAGTSYSFEFFPPRNDAGQLQLEQALQELEPLGPSYVSVTYGAGGTTRERTHEVVVGILRTTSMTPMAHLTCAAHTRAELVDIVTRYREAGIENILALHGDPPAELNLPPGELDHALELVELVREVGAFSIGVAAHPEGHPHSPDLASDRRFLAAKLAAADFAVTQFAFRASDYLRLYDDLAALGITKPVIPGIMPVTNVKQVERMAQLSGAAFPPEVAERLYAVGDDPDAVRRTGVEMATELCRTLLDSGVPGLHFYTLNRSTATREIYSNLGLSVGE
jgi:methylenetetrahydrofolate reductase (NADPH)